MSCQAHELAERQTSLTEENIDDIIRTVGKLPDKDVLVYDLGCGVGAIALAVMQGRQNAIKVVSVDNRDDEVYWVGIAMQNIGRRGDWEGVSGDVLDKSIVPAEGSIHLLIIDVDNVDLSDILKVWKSAMHIDGSVWHEGKLIAWGETIFIKNRFAKTEGDSHAEEQEQTEEGEETKTEEVEPSMGDEVRSTTQSGKNWSVKEDERPPCKNCGYSPPADKSYVHAMRAHERIHNQ